MEDSKAFWGLIGVIIGFFLNMSYTIVMQKFRIIQLKRALRNECKSLLGQIPLLIDIFNKCIISLKQNKILPGRAVRSISTVYYSSIVELTPHLSPKERNLLHVVHERLTVGDEILANYFNDIIRELNEKIIKDPFKSWIDRMTDQIDSYQVIIDLLNSYLDCNPKDVFLIDLSDNERQRVLYK